MAVAENTAAESCGSERRGTGACGTETPHAIFVKTGLALAVGGALGAFAVTPAWAAVIDTAAWATEENVNADPDMTTLDVVMDATGGVYGPIEGWSGWTSGNKFLISITGTGGITEGVWQSGTSEGRLGQSGRLLHWGIINAGSIVDQETLTGRPDGKTQNLGSTNWITKFANTADGILKVWDLRSEEVQNASEHFEVGALHLREGGTLENLSGGIMTVGDLRVGVADAGVFESFGVTLTEDNSSLSLPSVTYSTGTTTRVFNSGTISADVAHIAGAFENAGLFRTTDAGAGESVLGTVTNTGTIDLSADARLTSLTQSGSAALLKGAVGVTVEGEFTNEGSVGESANRVASLSARDSALNSGSIHAVDAAFKTLTNAAGGTLDVSGELSIDASGLATNSGTVTAGTVAASGDWTNETGSSLTLTGGGTSTFKGIVNRSSISLDGAAHTGTGTVSAETVTNAGTLHAYNLSAGTLSTSGTVTARGTLTVSNLTEVTDAGAQVQAASFALQALSNRGTVTETGTGSSTFGAVANGGIITIAHATSFASLTNTLEGTDGTIAGTGELTITGDLANAGTIGSDGARLGRLTAEGSAQNTGAVFVRAAEFRQALTNTSTILSSGTLDVAGTLTNSGAITADGIVTLSGTGSENTGTVTANDGGLVLSGTFTNRNAVYGTAGVTVKTGGVYTNAGKLETNLLSIEAGGRFVNAADTGSSATILKIKGAGTLENSADLLIGGIDAANTAGITYRQTGGTLTVADGTWFDGATLSIEGGRLIRTNALADTLGANDVTISGTGSTAFANGTQLTGDWRSAHTYVHVGKLNSDATVKLDAGGILEADRINLTADTLTFSGGALAGSLSSLFDTVTQAVYTIDTGDEHHLASTILGATDVGAVKTAFADHAQWDAEGGAFVITDEYVSLGAITRASEKLAEAAGGSASAVVYTGTLADSGSASEIIYHETFGALKNEQNTQTGSKFTNPGVVFALMTYSNKANAADAAPPDSVVIGASDAVVADAKLIDRSIGFRKVEDASSVTVQDGKIFTLTGAASETPDELVGSALGQVAVTGTGSLFNLGSAGVAGTKGHLGTLNVTDDGGFRAVNGTYSVDLLSLTNAAGKVLATADLKLAHYGDDADSTLDNAGRLTLSADNVLGTLTNSGTLTVGSDSTLNGTLTNAAGGTAAFKALTLTGGLTNDFGAKLTAESLTVDSSVAAGDAVSNGRLVLTGDNLIRGHFTLGRTSETEVGRTVAQGVTTVRGGTFTVNGDALLGSVKALTGTLAVGEGALLYVEGNDGISAGIMGTFSAGADSVVAAKVMNLMGVNRVNENAELRIGTRAMSGVDAERLAALKGSDWTAPTQSASVFALRSAGTYSADMREYDVNATTFLESGLPSGESTADRYFGGNANGDNLKIANSVTMSGDSSLILTNNIFITETGRLTIGPQATIMTPRSRATAFTCRHGSSLTIRK